MMATLIRLGDIAVEVVLKDIKHVHLSVYPPTGRVRISAPLRMNLDTIRVFAISKLAWIKKHQKKIVGQERETPREYVDRESHYVWGKRYLLKLVERDAAPQVELRHSQLVLQVRPGSSVLRKQDILDEWYRGLLRAALPPLIARWETHLGVTVGRVFVQRMRTRWGSCSVVARSIRLNTDLAKKPPECLEYIIVHEMAHLLEPTHSDHFASLMDRFVPKWRFLRQELNRLPVRHEDWGY